MEGKLILLIILNLACILHFVQEAILILRYVPLFMICMPAYAPH